MGDRLYDGLPSCPFPVAPSCSHSGESPVLKKDVKVGEVYVTNQGMIVRITEEIPYQSSKGAALTRWAGVNIQTNRKVTIKSAAKLKRALSEQKSPV